MEDMEKITAKTLIEAMLDPVMVLNQKGIILEMNSAVQRLFGYGKKKATGKHFLELSYEPAALPKELKRIKSDFNSAVKEGTGIAFEYEYITKKGKSVIVSFNGSILKEATEQTINVVTILRDVTERKKADEIRREREEKYKMLLTTMPTGWAYHKIILDKYNKPADYVFLEVNDAFEEFTGLKREDIIGKRVTKVIPDIEDAEPDLISFYGNVALTGKSDKLEFYFKPLDKWYSVSVSSPEKGYFFVNFQDITERRRVEEVLKESHHFLRERVKEMTCLLGVSELFRDSSKTLDNAFFEMTDVIRQGLQYPNETCVRICVGDQQYESDGCIVTDWQLSADIGLDGTPMGVIDVFYSEEKPEVDVGPFLKEERELIKALGRQVGAALERRRAEEALKKSEQELALRNRIAQVFLTVAEDEVMYDDILTIVLETLDSEFGVLGYIDKDGAFVVPSMTRHIWDQCKVTDKMLLFPRDTWGDSTWPRAIREKRSICQNESSMLTPQGHIPISRHISLPIIHHGDVIGLFQVANKRMDYDEKDVQKLENVAQHVAPILSARLQRDWKEEERERTVKKLEVAIQELESFSYSVSHDLRAPLRGIDGFSKVLLEDYSDIIDETGQDYLRRVRVAAIRMNQLIDDILSLSRVSRAELCIEKVDLTTLANAIVAELRERELDREVEIKISEGLIAYGDKRLLRQVMENLLANAWKFTSKHSSARIEFGLTTRDEESVYFVSDDGAGFDMKYADKLFGVFQRVHSADEFEGTGVGLAIVKRIVNRHGGRVWAEGGVEKGATFYFTLSIERSEGDS
jgi:PAS domain S-box-containing protein